MWGRKKCPYSKLWAHVTATFKHDGNKSQRSLLLVEPFHHTALKVSSLCVRACVSVFPRTCTRACGFTCVGAVQLVLWESLTGTRDSLIRLRWLDCKPRRACLVFCTGSEDQILQQHLPPLFSPSLQCILKQSEVWYCQTFVMSSLSLSSDLKKGGKPWNVTFKNISEIWNLDRSVMDPEYKIIMVFY